MDEEREAMNRLWVRLTLAFALVIAVTLGIVGLLAARRTGEAFRLYLSYSDPDRYEALAQSLASYYQARGGWQGVEELLDHVEGVPGGMMRGRHGMTFQTGSRLQVVVARADGQVLYDGQHLSSDRTLSRDEQAAALSIEVGGRTVGYLVASLPIQSAILGPLEQTFFDRLKQMLLAGALLAGALGLLVGVAFSRSLSAPLQRLVGAARAVENRDFSHRVKVEGSAEVAEVSRSFNEMAEALQQGEELRKNLMADVAHELRTPLSVLQGNLQAILDGVYPLDKREIETLHDQTQVLSRLVDDLRELALADAGQLPMNRHPTDLGQVVRSTVEQHRASAENQGVRLAMHMAEDLAPVCADPDRTAQVLRNLLVNALQHTPSGGSIDVTVSAGGGQAIVTVRDTGEGIAAENLPHIFDRFWRAEKARPRDERWAGGSGLGLSIAQSLVKAQGGTIWAESQLGQGAVFRFTLPTYSVNV